MKKKQMLLKKLDLNKNAITALDMPETKQVAGGATAGISVCSPCPTRNPVTVCGNCPTGPQNCPTSGCA
ncbi:class I lanthipeptide [Taibaiella koreensis]|uniref:class I lanthipeptide n=1 Tax=Taibaiella koreensis TaxID=1268548 RepID=UPI000E59CB84|nr:class I lanthipeptide [Taibaiella koreensis]